jgi:hypothetical protein
MRRLVLASGLVVVALLALSGVRRLWLASTDHPLDVGATAADAAVTGAAVGGATSIERAAEDYVRLALALGRRAPRELDGYVGPTRLGEGRWADATVAEVAREASALASRLGEGRPGAVSAARDQARRARLVAQVRALAAVAGAHAHGGPWESFDAEARAIYGVEGMADAAIADDVAAARAELARLVPGPVSGSASLAERVAAYRRRFVVPMARRRALFEAAMDACRASTQAHWPLPAAERVQVTWGLGGPWGAWHRYQGGLASTLEMSTASLELVDNAIDLACHEAYPGHHAQFVLLDGAGSAGAATAEIRRRASSSAVPVELTVSLLRSPLSLLREGAATYAVELAFPPDQRLRVERDVLFPLAGLDGRGAAGYQRVRVLMRRVEAAVTPVVRDYRDGRLSRAAAAMRLRDDALVAVPEPLLRFVDDLGAYVAGYGWARDRVADAVEARARVDGVDRWRALGELLTESDPGVLQRPR